MKLLFVTGLFPFPANFGSAMRTSAVLQGLAELGHEIHLIAFGEADDERNAEAKRLCKSVTVAPRSITNLSRGADYWQRLRLLPSPIPYGTHRFRSVALKHAFYQIMKQRTIDAVVCDTLDCMVNVPSRCPVPVILNSHNIEYRILQRYLAFERNPARWLYAALEMRKLRRWEKRSWLRAGTVLVCSEYDKRTLLQMCPSVHALVVPNTVDTTAYVPCPEQETATILYSGGMDWYPNRDAVEFFAHSILPKIREHIPQAKFLVGGRNPSPKFRAQFDDIKDIEFTGTVPDMRPVLARATVCVVPLRIGSGTRLKILEASTMGKPIVSTSLGAEGLDFRNGTEIILANEPQAFASAVVDLLSDRTRRTSIGRAARSRVEHCYGFEALKVSLDQAFPPLTCSK